MKLIFFEIEGWEEKQARGKLPDCDITFTAQKMHEYDGSFGYDFDAVSVFVNSNVSREAMAHFPSIKLVATRSTGYDHIDIAACRKRGIRVAFVPGYGNNTVAEFAFGLLLNLTRKIYDAIDRVKEKGEFSYEGFRGIDLKGKTIGIIGTGRIGKEAIRIAKGFGMNVLAFDTRPDSSAAGELGFIYVNLDELLSNSDFISIHAPYNESTRHIINSVNAGKITKGAYLINTARGGIVETKALVNALSDGTLAGAGLDVLEEERAIKDEMGFFRAKDGRTVEEMSDVIRNHILMRMPNVLITPHNAFNTKEALERILNTTIDNIKMFIKGEVGSKSFVA